MSFILIKPGWGLLIYSYYIVLSFLYIPRTITYIQNKETHTSIYIYILHHAIITTSPHCVYAIPSLFGDRIVLVQTNIIIYIYIIK